MNKEEIKTVVEQLLAEIEEEDIGISLYTTFYQSKRDLQFFKEDDRDRVLRILKKLSEDSLRHKELLEKIILTLGGKLRGQ